MQQAASAKEQPGPCQKCKPSGGICGSHKTVFRQQLGARVPTWDTSGIKHYKSMGALLHLSSQEGRPGPGVVTMEICLIFIFSSPLCAHDVLVSSTSCKVLASVHSFWIQKCLNPCLLKPLSQFCFPLSKMTHCSAPHAVLCFLWGSCRAIPGVPNAGHLAGIPLNPSRWGMDDEFMG